MSSISSLKNIHKLGLFGNYIDKNENKIIKIKEIKNINLFQVVKYKNSIKNISNLEIDGVKLSETLFCRILPSRVGVMGGEGN